MRSLRILLHYPTSICSGEMQASDGFPWSAKVLRQLERLKLVFRFVTLPLTLGTATAVPATGVAEVANSAAITESSSPSVEQRIAVQEFLDAKRCLESSVKTEFLSNSLEICLRAHKGNDATLACAAKKLRLEAQLQTNGGRAVQRSCSGDPKVLQIQYRDAVTKAASMGDADAQMCYVQGWFAPASPSAFVAYKAKAPAYMRAAFARGDWRVLQLLIDASDTTDDGPKGLMTTLSVVGTPFTIYRSYTLLGHGSTGAYARFVKILAQDERAKLTRAQIRNADIWAAQEYRRHFSTSPRLSASPIPCFAPNPAD